MVKTRAKRLLEPNAEDSPESKRCFSNLTNFKSPKSRKISKSINSANKLTNYFKPVVKPNNEEPVAQESTQCSQIVISQPPNDSIRESNGGIIGMIRCVKKVLEDDFKDVSKRLQLQSIPPYLYNLKSYNSQIEACTGIQLASKESEYMAKSFLSEDRHCQFIYFVRNSMCGRKEFPGFKVIHGILELILKISNDECNKTCVPTQQALVELHSLFTSILITFPLHPLRESYMQLFDSPFKVYGIQVGDSKRGIFHSMLDLLNELIHHDETSDRKQVGDHDKLNNFYFWDAQSEEKSSFLNFSREEKFERIFLVLDLLIGVLENDLAMFIVRCSSKLRSSIANKDTCPLVCSVLFQTHETVTVINSTIKNIISIYVNMIALNYPKEKVQILARLLNLISHVLNLKEYPDKSFEHPTYKNISTDLVHEVQKTVENSPYYSIGLILNVAENARSSLIQMLLASYILQTIHNITSPLSLHVPFELIQKNKQLQFKDIPETVEMRNEKYQLINPNMEANRRQITQCEYLKLLKIYAVAFNNFYQIERVSACFQKKIQSVDEQTVVITNNSGVFDFEQFKEKLKEINLNEEVSLSQVDLTYKKLFHIKLTKETSEFYRQEIKNFLLLKKLIKICHVKFLPKFKDWKELVKELEV